MRKFYCQDCGTEVPLELDTCPKCHKVFGSVMCPKCNYKASGNKFLNGCPKCGYLADIKEPIRHKKQFSLSFKLFFTMFSFLIIIIIFMLFNF